MKTAAIIAEYNPFHNGHKYHIEKTKKELGVTHTVAIMSGNFVMRGEPAAYNKLIRAEAAVRGGADLVVELPVCFALSSAEHFAYGGVLIAELLGGIDFLSFGSETGSVDKLMEQAALLESEEVNALIAGGMKNGKPVFKAISEALGEENSHSSPNDILGVNYLKALKKLGSSIVPYTVAREGEGYSSLRTEGEYASAMGIRKLLEDGEDVSRLVPAGVFEFLKDKKPVYEENYNQAVTYAMRMASTEKLLRIRDVAEGLENAFASAASECFGANEIAHRVKSKRYAFTRLKRIIYNNFLDIDKNEIEKPVTYIRVLAFNDRGRELIKSFAKTAKVPLITNPTRKDFGMHHGLALEVRASELYSLGEELKTSKGDLRSIYIH